MASRQCKRRFRVTATRRSTLWCLASLRTPRGRRAAMPANLFAAWAGRPLVAECTDAQRTHDRASAPAFDRMGPIAATVSTQPVTEVAEVFWAGLRQTTSEIKAVSGVTQVAPQKTVSAEELDAGDPVAWRTLFDQRFAYRT